MADQDWPISPKARALIDRLRAATTPAETMEVMCEMAVAAREAATMAADHLRGAAFAHGRVADEALDEGSRALRRHEDGAHAREYHAWLVDARPPPVSRHHRILGATRTVRLFRFNDPLPEFDEYVRPSPTPRKEPCPPSTDPSQS